MIETTINFDVEIKMIKTEHTEKLINMLKNTQPVLYTDEINAKVVILWEQKTNRIRSKSKTLKKPNETKI